MIYALMTQTQLEPDPLSKPSIQGLPVHHPTGDRVFFQAR